MQMDCKTYFNGLAPGWDQNCRQQPDLMRAIALIAGAGPGQRMLDIASGTGITFPYLLERGIESLTAIDLAPAMVEIARQKFPAEPRLQILCGDLLGLEAPPFSCALLYNGYPHFTNKAALLKKVAALLEPGGRFTVAHGMGREALNAHHGNVPPGISQPLGPAREEAALWAPYFHVDGIFDRPDFYLLTGLHR